MPFRAVSRDLGEMCKVKSITRFLRIVNHFKPGLVSRHAEHAKHLPVWVTFGPLCLSL